MDHIGFPDSIKILLAPKAIIFGTMKDDLSVLLAERGGAFSKNFFLGDWIWKTLFVVAAMNGTVVSYVSQQTFTQKTHAISVTSAWGTMKHALPGVQNCQIKFDNQVKPCMDS